jgi:crotonobetainyl-CoA:carnitine CoA-transferase CaiB-like acyl-CoA transferase
MAELPAAAENRDDAVSRCTKKRDAYAVMAKLQEIGIACGVVQSGADLAADPHLDARGFIQTVSHPSLGEVRVAGLPLRFTGTDLGPFSRSPLLGEHNEEIICGLLGHSRVELVEWMEQGVVD